MHREKKRREKWRKFVKADVEARTLRGTKGRRERKVNERKENKIKIRGEFL